MKCVKHPVAKGSSTQSSTPAQSSMPWSDGVVAGAKFIGGTGLGSGRNKWMGAWPRRVAQFQARGTVEAVNRPGTAAPCAVARHCHAKIGGAAGPATSTVAIPVVATSVSCRATMHGAAQAFGRARVRFKISFQKVLKLKKKIFSTSHRNLKEFCRV